MLYKTNFRLKFYNNLALAQQLLAIINALYGCISIYRVSYFVSVSFILAAFHQMFAPEMSDEELEALMKGQKTETSDDVLGNGDILSKEDEDNSVLKTESDMGN